VDAKRPITAEDLNNIHYVQDPQISPDGRYVAFVKVTPDALGRSYKRNIWLYPTTSDDSIQLTRGNKDSQPRWSPDGTQLAFVSKRDDKPQIYILPTEGIGGEARALTSMENSAHSPDWSPDGSQIAFLSPMNTDERIQEDSDEEPSTPPTDKLEETHRKERKAEDEKIQWDPRPMWRIPYRRGTSYVDERYNQIYVISVDESLEGDNAKTQRLTDVNADHAQPRWSSDGTQIFTSRTFTPEDDEPWRTNNIYTINVESKESKRWVDDEYSLYSPTPSLDGKWIACGRSLIGVTDVPMRFLVMASDGSDARIINKQYDREVNDWAWSPDNKLAFTVASEGTTLPYLYDPVSDTTEQLHDGLYDIEQLDIGKDGMLAMSVTTPQNPQELYTFDSSNGFQEATTFNHKWLDEVIIQDVHEFRFQSPHGEIQGWYIHPVGYEDDKQYPLALNIHGGPHATWGYCTKTMWHEWQFHAARGYAVFYCNPHGSGGYGDAFMAKLHSAWGHVAMDDIMAGVDAFLELGIADENRMALTGGSYGGYMTAWIVGHSDRFKSAVSQRGVYNIASFYGTSDVPVLMSNEFDAEPWEDFDKLWEHSPLKYAPNIKTPLLLIHSENDYRVPIEQSEQLFAWVRRATDTPIQVLRYPRDGHELSRSGEPDHRVSRLSEMVDWFDKYIDG
jgi:dipeptidyl aminopeptidase/acylaminoacyl peptidase